MGLHDDKNYFHQKRAKKVMQNILNHVNITSSGLGQVSVTHECIELVVKFLSCFGFLGSARGPSTVGASRGSVANGSSCECSSGQRNIASIRIKSKKWTYGAEGIFTPESSWLMRWANGGFSILLRSEVVVGTLTARRGARGGWNVSKAIRIGCPK